MKENVGLRLFAQRIRIPLVLIGSGILGLYFLVKPFLPFPSSTLPAWGESLIFIVMVVCLVVILYGLAGVVGEIWIQAWMLWQKAKTRLARGQRLIGS